MKLRLHVLSLLVFLLLGCQNSDVRPPGQLFRVVKIEHKTLRDELIPEYANGMYWITCIVIEPAKSGGMEFRFGCEEIPEYCRFFEGGVFRAASAGFVSFGDWSHRYETIHHFSSTGREVFQESIGAPQDSHATLSGISPPAKTPEPAVPVAPVAPNRD